MDQPTILDQEIKTAGPEDPEYPLALKKIKNPPKTLYYLGRMLAEEDCLAVVGSRFASPYGKAAALELAKGAVQNGLTIVSGLAVGIDSCAHKAAVQLGRRTIAVLGGGLDIGSFYPRENIRLAQEILDSGGALISEYPPGTKPARYTFPQRNRVIAGLVLGVLVVEAKLRSGALLTADWAKKYNKKIFAVPGPIHNANSQGCNRLIKNGAMLAEDHNDILKGLHMSSASLRQQALPIQDPNEQAILKVLEQENFNIEKIIEMAKIDAATAARTIILLEMKGAIIDLGGGVYGLAR
ncbi:MAG: DNA-processing protein DprA [Candidatus Paceibacterota bacterium]|jgi:DNA processing protein